MLQALEWDAYPEATSDPTIRRAQRAAAAARDVLSDRHGLERDVVQQLLRRLTTLKTSLQARILGEAGGVTDFRRMNTQALIADVDRLIVDATGQLAAIAERGITRAADLGEQHADQPVRAAQLAIRASLPGLDRSVVTTAFDNAADLLTQPMQQFRQDVVTSIRRVAVAGDNRMTEINRLRDRLAGQGFDNAAFRAERIVRTEVGRVFNEASFVRLQGLGGDFPFLKKGWRAIPGNRTRLGHKQAHQTYSRGNGIRIADSFYVNVHTERPGQPAKLIGVARLRFPIDPDAAPAGRIAASATIMCRCSAFVDFDIADFSKFATARAQVALQGLRGPAPEPPPAVPTPRRQPATRRPRLPKPKALPAVVPGQVIGAAKPQGTPVSTAVKVDASPRFNKVRAALAMLDSVHGDGELGSVTFGKPLRRRKGLYGYYSPFGPGGGDQLAITGKGLGSHPLNTVFHESGHWLDRRAFGTHKDFFASEQPTSPGERAWATAAKSSATIQRLSRWRVAGLDASRASDIVGYQGDGNTPKGVVRSHLDYLLSTREVWARAYAQYIALRSGNKAALAELRLMQKAATSGPVRPDQPYNRKDMGKEPIPDSWDYPVVWPDDEFEPIAQAIDQMLEEKGWRTKGAK